MLTLIRAPIFVSELPTPNIVRNGDQVFAGKRRAKTLPSGLFDLPYGLVTRLPYV